MSANIDEYSWVTIHSITLAFYTNPKGNANDHVLGGFRRIQMTMPDVPTPDASLVDQGTLGIVIYALLFIIAVRELFQWLTRRSEDATRKADMESRERSATQIADSIDRSTEAINKNTLELALVKERIGGSDEAS